MNAPENHENAAPRRLDKAKLWQSRLMLAQESGLSQKDFCQSQNLSLSTFRYWHKKLRGEQKPEKGSFVEVTFPPKRESSGIEILLGRGILVRVKAGFDQGLLQEVIRTVRSL
jgi:hypothetical protein